MIPLFSSPSLLPGRPTTSGPRARWPRTRARLAAIAAVTAATTLVAVSTPAHAARVSASVAPLPGVAATPAASAAGSAASLPAAGGPIVEIDRGSVEPDRAGIDAAVRSLQPYVHRTAAGTFRVDAPAAVVAGIPAATYTRVMASARAVNQDITAGRFVARPDGRITLAPALVAAGATVAPDGTVTAPATAGKAKPGHGGRSRPSAPVPVPVPDPNTLQVHWWGVEIHLNSDSATMLINALQIAVAIDSLLTLLVQLGLISAVASVPLAIIAGILGLVIAALTTCQTDRGLNLDITWIGIGWCTKPVAA